VPFTNDARRGAKLDGHSPTRTAMILTSRAALTGCEFHVEFARRVLSEKHDAHPEAEGF